MKYAIVDISFAGSGVTRRKTGHGLAATYLNWVLEKHGVEPVTPDNADTILLTMNSPEQLPQLRTFVRKHKGRLPRFILGGVSNPAAVMKEGLVDACVCGEGHTFMEVLLTDGWSAARELPEVWRRRQSEQVIQNDDFPWEIPPLVASDGTLRVFASRGCRYRCFFCQTGWGSRYKRNPNPNRMREQARVLHSNGKRVSVITNDGSDPDLYIDVPQQFVSARFDGLKKMLPLDRKKVRSVCIGVEGVSERLRTAIKKTISHDELGEMVFQLAGNNIQVKLFYVVGLPGETAEDWEELKEFQRRLRHVPGPRVTCNLHSFLPMPAAPLGVLPLEDSYWERLQKFRKWAVGGEGWTKKVLNVFGCQPKERNKRAVLNIGAPLSDLRRGWFEHDQPNWQIKYRVGPDALRRLAKKYADNVGLKL